MQANSSPDHRYTPKYHPHPSPNIQMWADKMMLLIKEEQAPLLQEIERQRLRIRDLELSNSELLRRLGSANAETEAERRSRDHERWVELPQRGLHQGILHKAPEASKIHEEMDVDVKANTLLEETKHQLAQIQEEYDEFRLRASRDTQGSRFDNSTAGLHSNKTEDSKFQTPVAAIVAAERMAAGLTSLKRVLQMHGMTTHNGGTGEVVLSFNEPIRQIMLDIIQDAKRRRVIPSTMDVTALERGDVKLSEFATLANNIAIRARANELKIGNSLREAQRLGWTVQQWIQNTKQSQLTGGVLEQKHGGVTRQTEQLDPKPAQCGKEIGYEIQG